MKIDKNWLVSKSYITSFKCFKKIYFNAVRILKHVSIFISVFDSYIKYQQNIDLYIYMIC